MGRYLVCERAGKNRCEGEGVWSVRGSGEKG